MSEAEVATTDAELCKTIGGHGRFNVYLDGLVAAMSVEVSHRLRAWPQESWPL